MEKNGQISTILGSALLFTVIVSVFSLPNKFSVLILLNGGIKSEINSFIIRNILWVVVVAVIILLLFRYIKKLNQIDYIDILQNENIRLTTGVFVAIDGLINLSNMIPTFIMLIQTAIKTAQFVGNDVNLITSKVIIVDVISAVIILCQIFLGIYLVKRYKKR